MRWIIVCAGLLLGAGTLTAQLGDMSASAARTKSYVTYDAEPQVVRAGQRSVLEVRFQVIDGEFRAERVHHDCAVGREFPDLRARPYAHNLATGQRGSVHPWTARLAGRDTRIDNDARDYGAGEGIGVGHCGAWKGGGLICPR